jgi:hypothetical protein
MNDRLHGRAAQHVREPGLAEAAGAEDRDDAGRDHGRAQPADVVAASEQGGRLVVHAVAHRAVQREQLVVQPLQFGSGIGAEPVAQARPVGLEAVQGRCGSADCRQAAQQVGEQRLVVRLVADRLLEGRQRLAVHAGAARCLSEQPARPAEVAGGVPTYVCKRAVRVGVDQAAAQFQRRAGVVGRRGRVGPQRRLRGRGLRPHHERVDLVRRNPEPVAVLGARHGVRTAAGPRAGHEHLERLRRVGRRLVGPDVLDQPVGAHRSAACERGEQGLGTLADDGLAVPAHPVEQGQDDRHSVSVGRQEDDFGRSRLHQYIHRVTTRAHAASEVDQVTGVDERTDVSERRRFLIAVAVFAVAFAVIGMLFGEDIALELQNTPTTELGWRFFGWLVSAPPLAVTLVTWHERRRLRQKQRRDRGLLLAAWIGLSMFILPSRTASVDSQFGTGALVGEPLSSGWAWGALAAIIGAAFTGLVLLVLRRTVDVPTKDQWDLTARFLERAWLVLLVVSLGFALYGGRTGVFHGGS